MVYHSVFIKSPKHCLQEPSTKRVRPVAKSNSLTGVITPAKTPALKRIGQSITVTRTHTPTQIRTEQNQQAALAAVRLLTYLPLTPNSAPSASERRRDLCPRPTCALDRSPPCSRGSTTASAGATPWRAMTSQPRRSNGKRCSSSTLETQDMFNPCQLRFLGGVQWGNS